MNNIIGAFLLALIVKSIVTAASAPIKQHWPKADLWWMIYPSWILGGLLAYYTNLNLLSDISAFSTLDPQVGRILTAVIVGGGANLIHDILDRPTGTTLVSELAGPGTMTTTVQAEAPVKSDEAAVSRTSASASSIASGSTQVISAYPDDGPRPDPTK